MNDFVVAKFGGTSMKDAQAITRSGHIAIAKQANIVVVSATSGSTNEILQMIAASTTKNWKECEILIDAFTNKHKEIALALETQKDILAQLTVIFKEARTLIKGANLLKECTAKTQDALLSTGERISSLLLTGALKTIAPAKNINFFDIRRIMRTDDQFGRAVPDLATIYALASEHLTPLLNEKSIFVTQGFIGATADAETTTLGRGGSDYSAALIAEAVRGKTLQIWTDVAGIATTDPRICPRALPIPLISFQEAAEMATFGAKILHPTTLSPALRENISVFVGSSFAPDAAGTWIKKASDCPPLVRALAMKKHQSLLTLTTPKMSQAPGFLYKIFKIFNDYNISIDAITTSEISVALTVDDATLLNKKLFAKLSDLARIKIEEDLSLISLIGNKVNFTSGLAQKIFTAIGDINVRMICQGASKHNFCFLVAENSGVLALQRLHTYFIEEQK